MKISCLVLGLALLSLIVSGCATSDPDNASVRPWDAPQSWENGMGGAMDKHEALCW